MITRSKIGFRLPCILFLLAWCISVPASVSAQSVRSKAEKLVRTVIDNNERSDTALSGIQAREQQIEDSIRLEQLTVQLQEMKLNEIMLRAQLESSNSTLISDSLKRAAQLREIDSLRHVTNGIPVVVENDTLFIIYASMGGRSPIDRAETIAETIKRIGKNRRIPADSIHTLDNEAYIDIMCGDKVIMSITDKDALWEGKTREELAAVYVPILKDAIDHLRSEHSLWQIVKRSIFFVLIILAQYLVIKLINALFRKLRRKIIRIKQGKRKGIIIGDYELINTKIVSKLLIFASNVVRYFIILLILIVTVPMLFSIFPKTENLAMKIIFYIIDPIRTIIKEVIDYIPNLFIIIVICVCIRYLVKGIKYIAGEIENEKLRISGFYPEWAQPTFNIIRFLLYAFMIAMIYPYLPGAHSGVFQGISVFVGLIVSLGSSTVIANFIAGFVITYMRPFKTGDFIKVKDTIGNVIEKTPFVTRLRTIKNEVVTIPNSFIMSSDTVNYSASARQYGLIIHTIMTMGYDVPWRKVHELLIDAALHTHGVLHHPEPFVLQTELNDNYMCYQINAYISNADEMPVILSDLLEHIQDNFKAANIDLVAPHFYSDRARH